MPKRKYDAASAVVLHMDLVHTISPEGAYWDVLLSRPGRDGEFGQRWECPAGRIRSVQLEDMAGWVQQSIRNATIAWSGVQEELET